SILPLGLLTNDTDPNNDPLVAILNTSPNNGTIFWPPNGSGAFIYTPTLNFNGVTTFTYFATDLFQPSMPTTVTINVLSVNDPPIANDDFGYTVFQGDTLSNTTSVLNNDFDADNPVLTATLLTPPLSGSLTLNPDGTFIYTTTVTTSGLITFTYGATDGLITDTATVFINVIAPLEVTTDQDVIDANAGNCATMNLSHIPGPDGRLSLREAICVTNNILGPDTIILPPGTYTITIPTTNEDYNIDGDFDIRDTLTINGAGKNDTIINGANIDRVFNIPSAGIPILINFTDLSIINGGNVLFGGAIYNINATLILTRTVIEDNIASANGGIRTQGPIFIYDSEFFDNTAISGEAGALRAGASAIIRNTGFFNNTSNTYGGAIQAFDFLTLENSFFAVNNSRFGGAIYTNGSTTINRTMFEGNIATEIGGAIVNFGLMQLNTSDIIGNQAADSGGGIANDGSIRVINSSIRFNQVFTSGAGIYNLSNGDIILRRSTINNNQSNIVGGGIWSDGIITMTNSTLSSNTAANGAGIFTTPTNLGLRLDNSTIANNNALNVGGGFLNQGPADMKNSLIADNTDSVGNPDCLNFGIFTSHGFNLLETNSPGCNIAFQSSDIINQDPNLGPLQNNGGDTDTHMLQFPSPALDNAALDCRNIDNNIIPIDQRGIPRPQGDRCDIGAYENNIPTATPDTYTTPEDTPLIITTTNNLLNNDDDFENDPLSTLLNSNPFTGTLDLASNGAFTYTPPLNYNGLVTFTYRAFDGNSESMPAIVTITVTAVNDPPLALGETYTMTANNTLTTTAPGILTNDTDPVEGDPLTAILQTTVSTGTLDLASNGAFTYTPPLNYSGTVTFTYYANDGDNSNLVTTTIIIEPDSCIAPAPLTDVTISISASAPSFTWTTNNADNYQLWWSTTPYFNPGDAGSTLETTVSLPPAIHPGGLGNATTNYYYLIIGQVNCGATSTNSNPTAEFDFEIVPGL
ncbi:MAG TPA: tandem-95 repeat protein, partial [Anaerolineae bacterium]|nr:tandem-95 repeat protein [Anaerolineae bacterium]